MIMLKLGYGHTLAYAANGIAWVMSFFLVRILPSPYMVYQIVYADYAAYTTADLLITLCTTPLPFMLNSYWFYLLFNGVIKFLSKRSQSTERSHSQRKAK